MAGVVVSGDKVGQLAVGYNADAALGSYNLNAMPPYTFPEVKTGLIATVFPSDSTWHPLYDHDYKELANHLFSIDTLQIPPEQKQALVNNVKSVTVESYRHGAMATMYKILIVGTLLVLFLLYVNSPYVIHAGACTAFLAFCAWVSAEYYAKGTGEAYWQTFSSDLNSRIRTGKLPGKILEEYGADLERERDRAALQRVNARPNQGGSTMLGALVGSAVGYSLR